MNSFISVVYTANDLYAPLLGISLTSLLYNNKEEKFNIYILSNGIKMNNIELLKKTCQKYRAKLNIINILNFEKKISFDIDMCGYNITTMARLFLADLLPQEVEKILYLDCDTMINNSIMEFWNTDIEKKYIAAVPEFLMPLEKRLSIGMKKENIYYNAGVLLINVKKWREQNLAQTFMEYYASCNGILQYNDQDIINYCCTKQSQPVSVDFDFFPVLYWYRSSYIHKIQPLYKKISKEQLTRIKKKPAIVHFVGDERPWVKGNHVPYRKDYIFNVNISEWTMEQIQKKGQWIQMQIYYICNLIALVCPSFRIFIGKTIGINKAKMFRKK